MDFRLEGEKVEDFLTFDLLVDGELHDAQKLPLDATSVSFTDIPVGTHRLEIWLPHSNPVRVRTLHVDGQSSVMPFDDKRRKWLTYGSSITQARSATSPSRTWPALVANRFDLHLICMGFGGNCKLETTVGRVIRDTPADFISMCLGINVYGGDLSPRVFREQVIGLVQLIREKQPNVPLVCISPIYSPPREETESIVGNTLVAMREQVRDAVEKLRGHGDANLHYVSGLDVYGPQHLEHMPDELHPSAEGQFPLAEGIAKHVMPRFGLNPG